MCHPTPKMGTGSFHLPVAVPASQSLSHRGDPFSPTPTAVACLGLQLPPRPSTAPTPLCFRPEPFSDLPSQAAEGLGRGANPIVSLCARRAFLRGPCSSWARRRGCRVPPRHLLTFCVLETPGHLRLPAGRCGSRSARLRLRMAALRPKRSPHRGPEKLLFSLQTLFSLHPRPEVSLENPRQR